MDERRAEYEAGFRRAGLPLVHPDRTAARDIWTRALPVLALVFWAELFGALDLTWPWWQNVLALFGGLLILLAAWGLSNRARGRKLFALPQDVGVWELAGFVVIPGCCR